MMRIGMAADHGGFELKAYLDAALTTHGQDMPEVRNWKWSSPG